MHSVNVRRYDEPRRAFGFDFVYKRVRLLRVRNFAVNGNVSVGILFAYGKGFEGHFAFKFTVFVGNGVGSGTAVAVAMRSLRSVFFVSGVIIGYIIRKLMPKFTADVGYGVGFVATVAFCGFSAVLRAGGVVIRNVIGKLVT